MVGRLLRDWCRLADGVYHVVVLRPDADLSSPCRCQGREGREPFARRGPRGAVGPAERGREVRRVNEADQARELAQRERAAQGGGGALDNSGTVSARERKDQARLSDQLARELLGVEASRRRAAEFHEASHVRAHARTHHGSYAGADKADA